MYRYFLAVSLVLGIQSSPFLSESRTKSHNEDQHNQRVSPRLDFDLSDMGYPQIISGETDDSDLLEEDSILPLLSKQGLLTPENRLRILGVLRNKLPTNEGDNGLKDKSEDEDEDAASKNPVLRFPVSSKRLRSHYRKGASSSLTDHFGHSQEFKRGGEAPSLSIVGPLEVLRQSKMWDNARRRLVANQERIRNNERILADKGKRSVPNYF